MVAVGWSVMVNPLLAAVCWVLPPACPCRSAAAPHPHPAPAGAGALPVGGRACARQPDTSRHAQNVQPWQRMAQPRDQRGGCPAAAPAAPAAHRRSSRQLRVSTASAAGSPEPCPCACAAAGQSQSASGCAACATSLDPQWSGDASSSLAPPPKPPTPPGACLQHPAVQGGGPRRHGRLRSCPAVHTRCQRLILHAPRAGPAAVHALHIHWLQQPRLRGHPRALPGLGARPLLEPGGSLGAGGLGRLALVVHCWQQAGAGLVPWWQPLLLLLLPQVPNYFHELGHTLGVHHAVAGGCW